MRMWREVLNDKLLGGLLCAVLLLSFAFQIATASRAAAAMIAPDPLSVICSSSDGVAHRPVETDHSRPCPCGELCAAGLHLQASLEPAATSGIPIRFADRIEIAVDHSAAPTARLLDPNYDAQAPPRVSN